MVWDSEKTSLQVRTHKGVKGHTKVSKDGSPFIHCNFSLKDNNGFTGQTHELPRELEIRIYRLYYLVKRPVEKEVTRSCTISWDL